MGGDPKTVHAFSPEQRGDPRTDRASLLSLGGDPITDQASLNNVGGDPKTDQEALMMDRGGDPTTPELPTDGWARAGWKEMFDWGGAGSVGTASSDAASPGRSTSTYGHGLLAQAPEWCGSDVGGDPRTGQASSHMGDDKKNVHFVREMGGDPKTDHEALNSDRGDPKNRPRFLR